MHQPISVRNSREASDFPFDTSSFRNDANADSAAASTTALATARFGVDTIAAIAGGVLVVMAEPLPVAAVKLGVSGCFVLGVMKLDAEVDPEIVAGGAEAAAEAFFPG